MLAGRSTPCLLIEVVDLLLQEILIRTIGKVVCIWYVKHKTMSTTISNIRRVCIRYCKEETEF